MEAEESDTETSWFCSTSCSTSKRDYLHSNKKGNGECYKHESVSHLLQSLEQSLRVAKDSEAGAKEWPEECLIGEDNGVTWGGSTFNPSSLLLLLPLLMKRVGMVHSSI